MSKNRRLFKESMLILGTFHDTFVSVSSTDTANRMDQKTVLVFLWDVNSAPNTLPGVLTMISTSTAKKIVRNCYVALSLLVKNLSTLVSKKMIETQQQDSR